jgi:multiple sugar transport system ATP-binding protein
MRSEISKIHEKVGATTIYVTHDQTEAMTMADRIVIMKDGWIQQIGSPKEVYNFPHNMFVGGFIGSPAMNFIKGTCNGTEFIIKDEEDESNVVKVSLNDNFKDLLKDYSSQKIEELKAVIDEDKKWLEENEGQAGTLDKKNNEILAKNIETKKTAIENHEQQLKEFEAGEYPLVLGIRPEDVIVKEGGIATLKCDIAELLGKESIIYTYIAGQRLIIQTSADEEVPEGSTFSVSFNEKKMHFFDVESTARIRK